MIKVLIADDETLVRAGIKAVLPWEENGFEVIGEAWNGEDAYNKILTLKPDILITDIKMPKVDGITLLKKIKEQNIPIKSIILSCFDDFDLVREGMKYGAKDYILKLSIEPEQLLAVLNEIKEELLVAKPKSEEFVLYNQDFRYLFVKKILKHEFLSEEQITNVIHNLGLSISLHHYKLVQLLPEQKIINNTDQNKQGDTLIYNILDQICKRQPGNEIIPLEKEGFLVIHSKGSWKNIRTQISASMKEYANTRVYFGSSQLLNDYQDFESGMRQSKKALECSVFYNRTEEIEYQNICSSSIPAFSYQKEQELYQALLSASKERAWEVCGQMLKTLKENLYPPAECFSYIMEILDVYRRAGRDYNISIRATDFCGKNIYEYIKNLHTLQECEKALYDFTEKLTADIQKFCIPGERDEILSVKEYVKLHYNENIDLNTAAKLVNISPSHLSSLFKKETGKNFSSYLTEVRMKEAKRLLKNPHAMIYEVAEQTGYANSGYFGKAFKKFYGITPEEYKKNMKKKEDVSKL